MRQPSSITDTLPVDDAVDDVFGEAVVLKPMKTISAGYREAVPDDARPPVITRGIYDMTRGITEPTSGGFVSKQFSSTQMLSIRQEPCIQCDLKKGDRVYFPERDENFEVSIVDDDPCGRWDIHLVTILEDT